MLNRHINIAHTARRAPDRRRPNAAPARLPQAWQARAVAAYQQTQGQALTALPELLAARVSALIDRAIDPQAIFVDKDAEVATVVVDGIVFRAHDQQVFLLRSCVDCGTKHVESAPLTTRADLGFALSHWKPLCADCPPEDPANWLENEI
jgi:hypothetical protein